MSDRERFKQLCHEMKIEGIRVTGVTRLKAVPARATDAKPPPRSLRVRVENEAMRAEIINKGRTLAKSENEATRLVFLKRDMTPMERADLKKSREKFWKKRDDRERARPGNQPPNLTHM